MIIFLLLSCLFNAAIAATYSVYAEYGLNLGTIVPMRIENLLSKAGVVVLPYTSESSLPNGSLILSFGNSSLSNKFLSLEDVKDEGFRIMSIIYKDANLIMSNGQPINMKGKSNAKNLDIVHYGAVVGAYAVLEQLGFSFLQPMDPIIPSLLTLPVSDISKTESPFWPKRTWQILPQISLNSSEVPSVFLFYRNSIKDIITIQFCLSKLCIKSSAMNELFEWFISNRQNRVEVQLSNTIKNFNLQKTQIFNQLQQINKVSHSYGIQIGADISIYNSNITSTRSIQQQQVDIQQRIAWAYAAHYDFISTELRLMEFTRSSCSNMLSLYQVFFNQNSKY